MLKVWCAALSLPPILLFACRIAAFREGHFFATMDDPPEAAQHHSTQGNEVGNVGQDSVGEHGQSVLGEAGAVAESLERNGGKQQDRRPANFLEPVNVVYILAGVFANALAGFSNEIVAFSELGCACRTGFGTGSGLALRDAVGAHGALLHLGGELAPFVLWNAEGARHHAVPAAHALGRIVGDGACSRLLQRSDGANRSTRRIVAV